MKELIIICGYDKIGQIINRQLQKEQFSNITIIEFDEKLIELAKQKNLNVITGDPADDSTLLEAQINKADFILCTFDDQALNAFITISAKILNPKIKIISFANSNLSMVKLKNAGSDYILLTNNDNRKFDLHYPLIKILQKSGFSVLPCNEIATIKYLRSPTLSLYDKSLLYRKIVIYLLILIFFIYFYLAIELTKQHVNINVIQIITFLAILFILRMNYIKIRIENEQLLDKLNVLEQNILSLKKNKIIIEHNFGYYSEN